MRDPLSTYLINEKNVRELHALHQFLVEKLPAVDLSDILRSEYVLIVSAFDAYIHDIVRQGMLEIFKGSDPSNDKYDNYMVPMSFYQQLSSCATEAERIDLFDGLLKKQLSKDSYQAPRSVDYALQLIDIRSVWTSLAPIMGYTNAQDVSNQLALIVNRRNIIAHESDIKTLTGIEKNEITRGDVESVIDFITRLVRGIEAMR